LFPSGGFITSVASCGAMNFGADRTFVFLRDARFGRGFALAFSGSRAVAEAALLFQTFDLPEVRLSMLRSETTLF
jgi:hypothetical protein